MQTRSSLLCGLSFSLTLLAATLAGAEEAVLLAQAAPPEAVEEDPVEPEPTADEGYQEYEVRPDLSDVEEIVVTGTRSAASADVEAADSVTSFGAADFEALGVGDIGDLAGFTPNLEIVTAGATAPTFFIRGVGLNDFNPNSTGAVAVYQDDVAINAPALQLGLLYDMQAVNVLRGPQGTSLGRNASAGAIKLYAKKPSGSIGGFLRSDFGNFGFQDYEGAVEAPMYEDVISGRLAFRLSKRDGTMVNRCGNAPAFALRTPYPGPNLGNPIDSPWSICGEPVPTLGAVSDIPVGLADRVNDTNIWAARATLLFEPTPEISFILRGHGSRRDELSRLGQSIGTGGNYCLDDKICDAPFANVPPELRDPGAKSGGVLGGVVNGASLQANYNPIEIRQRLIELAPCFQYTANDPRACNRGTVPERQASNRAKIQLAEELAARLDSDPWAGDFNRTGPTRNDTFGTSLKTEVELPREVKLSMATGYDSYERLIDIDLDFSPETLFQILTRDRGWQFYQDLKLEGELDLGSVRWEVGGWILRERLEAEVFNDFGKLQGVGVAARSYDQQLWSSAGYAFLARDFWDDFTLDGGFRFNWETKQIDMNIVPAVPPLRFESVDESWSAPTGTVRLTYRFREDTHAFFKYSRGWKPGTFNATASQYTGVTTADPEELDAWEAGLRGSWFDGMVDLNGTFFYYAYADYQIFTATQFLGGNPEFVILNANDAEVYGAEIETIGRPWEGGYAEARFGWLESQFLDFVKRDQFLAQGGGQDVLAFRESQYAGNPLLNSPRFKISLTAEQEFSLGRFGSLALRWDGVWTDTTYYDPTGGRGLGNIDGEQFLPDDTIAQRPLWLHNLRATWRDPGEVIEFSLWARNLTNEAYKTFAFDGTTFRKTTIYFVGDPRTYGASFSFSF